MAIFLLDTSIIIDALNGKRNRGALLLELLHGGHLLACCSINITEVYAGLRPTEEAKTQRFLESLQYYVVTSVEARLAGELKRNYSVRGVTLSLGDVTKAAVALHNRLTLITDNRRHFPMKELKLLAFPGN